MWRKNNEREIECVIFHEVLEGFECGELLQVLLMVETVGDLVG
jgi:hypothetical protein